MSRVYSCQVCGNTVSKFFVHHCPGTLTSKTEEHYKSSSRAADDIDVISKRIAELRKEREDAQNKKNEEEAQEQQQSTNHDTCRCLSIGDIVYVAGFGTVNCVIAELVEPNHANIIFNNAGQLVKQLILVSSITKIIAKQ